MFVKVSVGGDLSLCPLMYCGAFLEFISEGDVGCTDFDIRLVNSNTVDPLEGRVEVCINNAWGTVCDTGFSVNDAEVICSQLGHPFSGMDQIYLYSLWSHFL